MTINKLILMFIQRGKTQNSRNNIEVENQSGELTLAGLQTFYKGTVFQRWCCERNR